PRITKYLPIFYLQALVKARPRSYNEHDRTHESMLRMLTASGNRPCGSPSEERPMLFALPNTAGDLGPYGPEVIDRPRMEAPHPAPTLCSATGCTQSAILRCRVRWHIVEQRASSRLKSTAPLWVRGEIKKPRTPAAFTSISRSPEAVGTIIVACCGSS